MTGWWALLIVLAVTLVVALLLRAKEGRITRAKTGSDTSAASQAGSVSALPEALRERLDEEPAAPVTLLQLSTTFCAPCRHLRIRLADLAARTEGVRHVEVDLTHHPEWSTPLRVHTTPTTLVLDSTSCELFRFSGVPRRAELADALRPHLA
ncbi:thioredoxin [Allosaccharopolyspora coralli]|uniref:Thioredoxin n=1 Tax=Allosaccharopolyspora coralli TaxID=2665642 RepID=A0A5Q3QCX5_9PSEU|nr:thioredoxin family protein [Allosaccharopolyspora coralli]QGK71750.1 thioredoxin [Allosaccharopolyspora coralli]